MNDVIEQLAELPAELVWLGIPPDSDKIAEAEYALGIKLPDEFLAFVRRFGWGGPEGLTIFGIDANAAVSADTFPSLVRETVRQREFGLPPEFLVIASSGDGGRYVTTFTSSDTIRVWYPEQASSDLEISDENFAEFLRRAVRSARDED